MLDPTKWTSAVTSNAFLNVASSALNLIAPAAGASARATSLLTFQPPLSITWRQRVFSFTSGGGTAGDITLNFIALGSQGFLSINVGLTAAFLSLFPDTGTPGTLTPTWTEDNNYHTFRLVWRKDSIFLWRDDKFLGQVPAIPSGEASAGYQLIALVQSTGTGAPQLNVDFVRVETETPSSLVDVIAPTNGVTGLARLQPWYQPNATLRTLDVEDFGGIPPPPGLHPLAVYTVPLNRLAIVTSAAAVAIRLTAATAIGVWGVEFNTNTSTDECDLSISNVIGDKTGLNRGYSTVLFPGQQWGIYQLDFSTGGTVIYVGGASIIEFDE